VLPVLAELRRGGVSCDVDYAGRSFKGQLTQAGRTGARTTAIVRGDGVTLRREGQADQDVSLADVVATLTR
jgi:histidyl-tRNA synthetase